MTREEKHLLIKVFSAMLPYGVIYHRKDGANIELREIDIKNGALNYTDNIVVQECKPYLRPMSSMTEDEKLDYIALGDIKRYTNPQYAYLISEQLDYLNAHHFDYRIDPSTGKTLIESNLAIEAPEGMYKTE